MSESENRRAFLKKGVLAAGAAIVGAGSVGNRLSGATAAEDRLSRGTSTISGEGRATQTVAMKPISLPELPPKSSKDVAAKLFPGFVQTEVRTSGATIPVFHKVDVLPV